MVKKGKHIDEGKVVAYIDDQPIKIGAILKELPPKVYEMDIAGVMAWAGVLVTQKEAEWAAAAYKRDLDLNDAIFLAEIFAPALVHRYRHTKKKRIRKKYEKRLIGWFNEYISAARHEERMMQHGS